MTGDGVKELVVVTTRGVQVNKKQNSQNEKSILSLHVTDTSQDVKLRCFLYGVNISGVASRPRLSQRSYN